MDRIPRRRFLLGLSALCIAQSAAQAQLPGKMHRIGYIQTATPDEQEQLTRAFDEGMRELGYLE
jgi:aspartate aminotransferase-like enzyme